MTYGAGRCGGKDAENVGGKGNDEFEVWGGEVVCSTWVLKVWTLSTTERI